MESNTVVGGIEETPSENHTTTGVYIHPKYLYEINVYVKNEDVRKKKNETRVKNSITGREKIMRWRDRESTTAISRGKRHCVCAIPLRRYALSRRQIETSSGRCTYTPR